MNRGCENCLYMHTDSRYEPCVGCTHATIDNWKADTGVLPCPFCGDDVDVDGKEINCTNCGLVMCGMDSEELKKTWNTREAWNVRGSW